MRLSLALLLGLLLALPFLSASPVALITVYMMAFAPYVWILSRADVSESWAPLVITAIIARLYFCVWEPVLSDDIYRYVWEGRVSLAGFNPFAHAPSSEVLAALRDAQIWPRVNHPEIPTIYPPIAQGIFALNALWDGGTTSLRMVFLAIEAGLCFVVVRALSSRLRFVFLSVYALNPLVIVEVAWSGHLDVIAYLSLCAAMLLWQRNPDLTLRLSASVGMLLGLSIGAKFLGVMGLGAMALSPTPHRWYTRAVIVVVAVMIVIVSYGPFADAGKDLLSGFGTYAASWQSNDSVFRAIYVGVEESLKRDGEKRIFQIAGQSLASDQLAATTGKAVAVLVMVVVFGFVVQVLRRPLYGFLVLMLTLLVMAPTVHPWYVAWLVPFAAVCWDDEPDGATSRAAVAWSASCILAYLAWWSTINEGPWRVPTWAVVVQLVSVFGAIWSRKRYLTLNRRVSRASEPV